MTHRPTVIAVLIVVVMTMASARAQTGDPYADNLAQGVSAFKAGHYEDAAKQFEAALAVSPESTTARLYLGTTYCYLVVPNLPTAANTALADKGIEVLNQLPENFDQRFNALKQIASAYRNTGRLQAAKDTELQALLLQPTDTDTLYTIGVLDWTDAYKFAVNVLAQESITDDGLGNVRMSVQTCQKLRLHNAQLVDDAILRLTRAIELKPEYADAMIYLNLIYRRRADLDCTDDAARKQDIALADKWSKQAVQIYAVHPQHGPAN